MSSSPRTSFAGAVHRCAYGWAALLYIAGLAYGSWLPFIFRDLQSGEAEEQLRAQLLAPIGWSTGADFVDNALLGVPLGYLLCGALRGPTFLAWLRFLPAVVASLAVSTTVEIGQVWIFMRVPSKADVVAQLCGSLGGCFLEYAVGPLVLALFSRIRRTMGTIESWRYLSLACVIGFLIYGLLPFDGFEPWANVADRWRELTTFGSSPVVNRASLGVLFAYLKKCVVFVPFGVSIYFWRSEIETRSTLLLAVGLSTAAAALVETGQLFLASAISDAADLLCAALGAGGGAAFMLFGWPRFIRVLGDVKSRRLLSRALGAACLGYVVCLCVLFWYPLDPRLDSAEVSERTRQLFSLPLVALWHGTNANAVSQVVLKVCLFGTLGGLLTLRYALSPVPVSQAALRVFGWTTLLGVALEVGQIWSPARIPDASDGVLDACAALVGYGVVRTLLPRTSDDRRSALPLNPWTGRLTPETVG